MGVEEKRKPLPEHIDVKPTLQGGIYSADQAQSFIRQTGAEAAVRLRIWDDLAKVDGLPTPPLSHYLERAQRCAVAAGTAAA